MRHAHTSARRQQRGAVLIIALVMLLLITMASIATIRLTTLDERMAGNSRDRDRALQAAEAAVRTCLQRLTVNVPANYGGPVLSPLASGTENWELEANWASSSTNSVEIDLGSTAGLSSNPRCLAERIGSGDNYRITGRAIGGQSSTVVMIQATYSTDY